MAVEFVAIQEFKTDGGTSILMTAPVGTSVGDLLIAYISKDDNVAIYTSGSYGDWNMVFNNIANGQTCLYIAWKWAEAGDAAETKTVYTWNGDSEDWLGEIICYSGIKAVTPIHGTPGISTGVSATPTAPSVAFTDLAVGSLVLQVMGIDSDDDDYVTPAQLTERFNAIQGNDIGGAGGDKANRWVLPTGFADPGTEWADEALAYDGDIGTDAEREGIPAETWSDYLELTCSALSCSKVRFYAYYNVDTINQISLDVYYSSGWHNIYEGAYAHYEWVEKAIGSTQTVTAMRVKFYNADPDFARKAFIYEANFWGIGEVKGTGETGIAVFTATSRPWAAATLIIEAAVAAGDYEYVGTGTFTYSGTAIQTHTKDYLTTASGQFAYSGSANQVYSKNYLYEGSGTLTFSGSAAIIVGLAFVGSGSLTYSGEAVQSHGYNFPYSATGELVYSGAAVISYLLDYLCTGTGELAYSGSATQSYTVNFSYEASGSFTYSGVGIYSLGFAYTASGEFAYSGSADCSYQVGADFEYTGSGSFAFSGTATQTHSRYYLYTASGELTYSGEAIQSYTKDFVYDTSGSFIFSGAGIYSIGFTYTGSGELTYSGEATLTHTLNYAYMASGMFTYSGEAECSYEVAGVVYEYVGSGQFTFSGTAFPFREIITFLSHITKEIILNSKIIKEIILNSNTIQEIAFSSNITKVVTLNSPITKESILPSKIHLEED